MNVVDTCALRMSYALNEADRIQYGAYGEQLAGGTSTRYKFTGKERDESGDDNFGARYYKSIGRFLTPDWSASPAAVPYATLSLPQSLNLYSYVQNNPITGIDPDGHAAGGLAHALREK